ncbi:MAG: amidoligase family protein [Micromonosporaceae bacterium]|nr:amidoligase family protein [Micromonosporaceae bacterium]
MTIVTIDPPAPATGAGPASPCLAQRIGFEIELLAPRGASRADLAEDLALRHGGTVDLIFHVDSEPSLVPGMTHFLHLTQGFVVRDAAGAMLCKLVDDITLRQDVDNHAAPQPGWYRIVSDEPRLLRLVHRFADPTASLESVLEPLAQIFGVPVVRVDDAAKVVDSAGATIAVAVPLPGERERPCEVITPPIEADHRARLEALLGPARELGFTVPEEAAVHLHLDASPLRTVPAFANLVRLFSQWREPIWEALGTNAGCRRLGALPQAVIDLVSGIAPPGWDALAEAAVTTGLTKYADINLTRLVAQPVEQDTVEIRCLPGSIDPDDIVARAALVERLVARCRDPRPVPAPRPGATLADLLVGPPPDSPAGSQGLATG